MSSSGTGFGTIFGAVKTGRELHLLFDAITTSSGREEPYAEHIVELLEEKGLTPLIRVTEEKHSMICHSNALEELIDRQSEELQNLKDQLGQMDKDRNGQNNKRNNLKHQWGQVGQQESSLEQNNVQFKNKYDYLAAKSTKFNNSLENLKKRNEIVQKENEKLKATQSSLERELETSRIRVSGLEKELESIKAENSKYQDQLKTMETSLHKLQRENGEFQKNRWSEHEVLQLKCIHQDEMKKLQKQLQGLETLINQLKSENTSKTEDINKLQAELFSLTTQHRNCSQLKQAALAFSEEVHQKEAKLPDRGTNNSEDVEIEKFLKYVLLNAEELGKLAEEISR